MNRFARTVLGYHGCHPEFARDMISGESDTDNWLPSENVYEWLGNGIYFWEYGPERAFDYDNRGDAIGAIIQLGNCLDLTDIGATRLLARQYELLKVDYQRRGIALPKNRGMRGDLDCLVINELVAATGNVFDTVRCPFLEGNLAYPDSRIYSQSHVQIAVRNPAAILGVFRPTPRLGDPP